MNRKPEVVSNGSAGRNEVDLRPNGNKSNHDDSSKMEEEDSDEEDEVFIFQTILFRFKSVLLTLDPT